MKKIEKGEKMQKSAGSLKVEDDFDKSYESLGVKFGSNDGNELDYGYDSGVETLKDHQIGDGLINVRK